MYHLLVGEQESFEVVGGKAEARKQWSRARIRSVARFYWQWLLSPLVGFRHRYETVVYYLTLGWGFGAKYALKYLVIYLHRPVTFEELAWRIPLWVGVGIGALRFLWFPIKQVEKVDADAEGTRREIERLRGWVDRDQPDVSVLFSWEKYPRDGKTPLTANGVRPPPFKIINYGAPAAEIQVHEFEAGGRMARFPLIPDLHADPVMIDPEISAANERESVIFRVARLGTQTIENLLEAADRRRERESLTRIKESEKRMTKEGMDHIIEMELAARLDIELHVTYWNRTKTRQWEKRETLCFEPNEHRAYILHGARTEVTVR
jgi:hypothetical protein